MARIIGGIAASHTHHIGDFHHWSASVGNRAGDGIRRGEMHHIEPSRGSEGVARLPRFVSRRCGEAPPWNGVRVRLRVQLDPFGETSALV